MAQKTGIHVSGTGKIISMPNFATVVITATCGQSDSTELGKKRIATVSEKIGNLLNQYGVKAEQVKTTRFNVQGNYVYEQVKEGNRTRTKTTLNGYSVTNQLTVKVMDLNTLAELMDATMNLSDKNTIVKCDTPYFDTTERTNCQNSARMAAVKDAYAKAKLFAEAAGISVGAATFIGEVISQEYAPRYAARTMAACESVDGGSPIAMNGGELEIVCNVECQFAIPVDE